jgi:hypothetical protein
LRTGVKAGIIKVFFCINKPAVKGERASDLISIIKLQHETLCEQLRIQNKKNDDLVEIINNLTKSQAEGVVREPARAVGLAGVCGGRGRRR